MIKISFVVSVYNKEKTLKRCIDSILAQVVNNYEIIIVDDGSRDGSKEIIKNYEKNPVVEAIYNTKNMGLGTVRYQGANISKGEYIVYVDADDEIDKSFSKKIENKVIVEKYDIVYVFIKNENSNGTVNIDKLPPISDDLNIVDRRKLSMSNSILRISGFAFRKDFIYEKRIFIKGQNFDEDCIGVLYPYIVNKIGIICEPLYLWHYQEMSMCHKVTDHYQERLNVFLHIYDYIKRCGLMMKYPLEMEAILAAFYINNIRETVIGREYIVPPKRVLDECRMLINRLIPNYKSNKYLQEYLENRHEKWLLDLTKANDISFEAFKEEFYAKYRDCYMNKRNKIQKLLDELHNKKINVAIWGAGLKGKTFLYYMDKEGKYIQYVIDGDKALRGREIDEYHKIYTYEDVIDLVDVILIMNTRHYNSIKEKVNTEIKIIDMDQYIDSENEVKNII